jgi:hypothetical protein
MLLERWDDPTFGEKRIRKRNSIAFTGVKIKA